jgi:hypothetical protein
MGHDESTRTKTHDGSKRNTLRDVGTVTGLSSAKTCDDEGQPNKVWLYYACSTPIQRHVKAKVLANPYDPACETYFEDREVAHMLDTFRVLAPFAVTAEKKANAAQTTAKRRHDPRQPAFSAAR